MSDLKCVCGRDMKIYEQDHHKSGTKLKFKCDCGNTGKILSWKNGGQELYVFNKDGELVYNSSM